MVNHPRSFGRRSRDEVLAAATRVLVSAPQTSLGDLAVALGVGRTTLHRMFPTRRDLLMAIAQDAIDHLEGVYSTAGLAPSAEQSGPQALEAIHRLVTLLIPLGPSLAFLLRATELDGDPGLAARLERLDTPLRATIAVAQQHDHLDRHVPDWWALETIFALVYAAWEQIDHGRLAPLDAADLVFRTWTRGVGRPDAPTDRL